MRYWDAIQCLRVRVHCQHLATAVGGHPCRHPGPDRIGRDVGLAENVSDCPCRVADRSPSPTRRAEPINDRVKQRSRPGIARCRDAASVGT